MKNTKSLLTHAAVFAVGVSLAMVAGRSDSDQSAEEAAAAARQSANSSSRLSASGESSADSAVTRERRESGSRSAKNQTPSERIADIVRIADPLDRQAALMDLINRLGPDQFAAVAEQYRNMDRYGDSRGEYDMILRGWARVDPLGALDYVSKQPNSRGETSTVLAAWAGSDASAAERWALDHHEGDGGNPWMTAVIQGLAAHDIARASQLIATMPNSRERGQAIDAITRALLVQGSEAAMAYPASIEDPQLRAGFVSEIAGRLAGKDPEKAAAWLASTGDAESQNRASRRVAEALARQNPDAAAKWVPTLNPAAQAEAARGVIPLMSSNDIAGTAKWVSTIAGIPNYDRVVEEFVWSCDQRAPEQSAAWIQGVSDPAQQARLYHRMLGGWARRDSEAVKAWVASNPVPHSVANRFK
jgi:hypothetical protein